MGVPREYWQGAYEDGSFLSRWDYDHPSQELVGALGVLCLPARSRVLDLGCGAGRDAVYLASIGFEVTGVDLSPAALAVAQSRSLSAAVDVAWVVGDALALPVAGPFDLITDRALFHHISPAERPRYAAEVLRVLRPGGTLLLRGAAESRAESFYSVDEAAIRAAFGSPAFVIGRVLPLSLSNNSGQLAANLVAIRKRD